VFPERKRRAPGLGIRSPKKVRVPLRVGGHMAPLNFQVERILTGKIKPHPT